MVDNFLNVRAKAHWGIFSNKALTYFFLPLFFLKMLVVYLNDNSAGHQTISLQGSRLMVSMDKMLPLKSALNLVGLAEIWYL